jgi:hypothetical protein
MPKSKTGAEQILEERGRHHELGWTAEHDDTHRQGELAKAAASYAIASLYKTHPLVGALWPFSEPEQKITSPIGCLVKAGAFIAAEIDRLQRLERSRRGD